MTVVVKRTDFAPKKAPAVLRTPELVATNKRPGGMAWLPHHSRCLVIPAACCGERRDAAKVPFFNGHLGQLAYGCSSELCQKAYRLRTNKSPIVLRDDGAY